MKPLEVARAVRALLACQAAWTKGANARRFDWSECKASDPEAVAWDLWGAMHRVAPGAANHEARSELAGWLDRLNDYRGISVWQDQASTLHAHVLALLDRAIGRLEEIAHAR